VIRDAVFRNEPDKVGWGVACERRLGKVWIRRKKIIRASVEVGEIAAASAGDENLFADPVRAFQHQDAPAAFARFDGAHQSGRTGTKDDGVIDLIVVELMHAEISLAGRAPLAATNGSVVPVYHDATACYHFRRGGAREIYHV